jgi:hypothetical protein
VRIALLLGADAVSGYAHADPADGVTVGELLHEVAAEPDASVGITVTTLVQALLEVEPDKAATARLRHLMDMCAILGLRAEDALSYAQVLVKIGRDDAGSWARDEAHDVLAAYAFDAPLLVPALVGTRLRSLFSYLEVLEL